MFFVNVPLAAVALLATVHLIAPDVICSTGRRFDVAGALTSTAGTTAIVFALVQGPESGWGSTPTIVAATAGILMLTAFCLIEKRSLDPLVPLRLLRGRNLSAGMAVTFLYMATIGTLAYFLTVYFQAVHGYNAFQTGVAYVIPMLAVVAGSLLGGRIATRFGMRTAMIGSLTVGALGTAFVGLTMSADDSYAAMVPAFIVLGLGQGAGYTLMFGAATIDVAGSEQGVASGMASTAQQVGGAVGLAVLVAVANSNDSLVDGLRTAVFLAALGVAATAVVALRFPRPRDSVAEASILPIEAATAAW